MKSAVKILAFATAALFAAGCTSLRTDPGPDSQMLSEVANAAVHDLLGSPKFHRYVERYRTRHYGRNPAIMLGGKVKVDETEKTDVNTAFLDKHLVAALVDAGMVEITKGYRPACITFAPDATPEQAEKGRDEVCGRHPDIVLRTTIATQKESLEHGRHAAVHQFDFSLYDATDGQTIWRFRKSTGLVRKP